MSYSDAYFCLKETYGDLHVEANYDGWDWFFHNGEIVGCYNDYTGEFVDVKEEVA